MKQSDRKSWSSFGSAVIIPKEPNGAIAVANNRTQPSLDDLAVFLAVCQTRGFRAAAAQLGMSPSKVSETISRLEAQLDLPLLTRTTRSVTPTEVGQALADRITPLLGETRAALFDAASSTQRVRGLLKLNVPGAVTLDILPALIERFLVRHPEVRVELVVDDRLVDINAGGCDAGIRYGEHLAQDMIAMPIGPATQQAACAASPAYLRERGMPEHPRDVMQHDGIWLRFSSGALVPWEFMRDGQTVTIDPPKRAIIDVDAPSLAIELARNGRGIIRTFRNWLDPYLASGELLPVLPEWWETFEGPRLYFSSRFMAAPLRAFVDMLAEDRG
jgi:DNA-binding transcriptional LysR family regulator